MGGPVSFGGRRGGSGSPSVPLPVRVVVIATPPRRHRCTSKRRAMAVDFGRHGSSRWPWLLSNLRSFHGATSSSNKAVGVLHACTLAPRSAVSTRPVIFPSRHGVGPQHTAGKLLSGNLEVASPLSFFGRPIQDHLCLCHQIGRLPRDSARQSLWNASPGERSSHHSREQTYRTTARGDHRLTRKLNPVI